MFIKEIVAMKIKENIKIDQVSESGQNTAQGCFTCGICFQLLLDPVCCANETCNYMLCRDHVSTDMRRCPNRCEDP